MMRKLLSILLVLAVCTVAGGAWAQEGAVFEETFATAGLAQGWRADVSAGNTVTPHDGWLEIRAAENTYAHIQRPLNRDHVRASCELWPGSGISWCASLFLYWGPGDWCQIGVIPRKGGRYYACITTGGEREERDLTRCGFAAWHQVAIELGGDCLRFVSSGDGVDWRTELIVPRPAGLAGPPALLIVGKGFGLDASAGDLDADYGERGEPAVSKVRRVRIEPLAPERMTVTPDEAIALTRVLGDPHGAAVMAAAGDPSFGQVAAVFPPLLRPREGVGVPDHPYEVGVAHDGTIQLAGEGDGWEQGGDTAWFEIGDPPVRFGAGGCGKWLSEGYLPIVQCFWTHDGLDVSQTVFGMSEGFRPDAELSAHVLVRIGGLAPPGGRTVPVALCVRMRSGDITRIERSAEIGGRSGEAGLAFRVPSPLGGKMAQEEPVADAMARLSVCEAWWAERLNSGMTVRTPEARVNDACRAWLAYNAMNVDLRDGIYRIHDGSGFYETIFGYSAALACNALDLWGRPEDARRSLNSMMSLVQPNGLFFENYGLPDMGALLLASCEHYELTGDVDWLRRYAPTMVRMCDWIIRKRRESMGADAGGARQVTHGLIRFTPYCDYPSQTFDYYGDAYSCIGLERTAHALEDIGLTDVARRLADEAGAYRADILASMDAAVIERDGMRLLPMEPDTHRLLRDGGYRGGGYYGLVASMLLESEFLAPADPRAGLVVDALERRGGLILGMCEFDEGVDHAYTYGYWLNCLRRDEVERVLLGFYGSLAYGMGRETYCGVEVTQLTTGDPTPTMPHTYSGTQQLRLLRMMLVQEEGEELILARATPDAWLESGKRIEIRNAPTSYGKVTYTLESLIDQGGVIAEISPAWRRAPGSIRLCVRTPGARTIRAATVNGRPVERFEADHLWLAPETGQMRVEIAF